MMREEKSGEKKTRILYVCDEPGCGVGYCCEIRSTIPKRLLWCDGGCSLENNVQCTKLRGYSGNPDDPYKPEIQEKIKQGENAPFLVKKGKCPDHSEYF